MNEKKSLIKVRKNKKGIRKNLTNIFELIKFKLSKNYILTEKSPEILRRNKDLIIKTINKKPGYLDEVEKDILLEELQQSSIPSNGIIDTAFRRGYLFSPLGSRPSVLFDLEPKKAILQYIKLQKDNNCEVGLKFQDRLSYILEYLDEKILLDDNFKNQLLDLAVEKGYKINTNSRNYLKQNSILATNYYRDLLEDKEINELLKKGKLSVKPDQECIKNKEFLQNYINLLSQKGIDNDTIVTNLTSREECISVFKDDTELLQLLFTQTLPSDLEKFFNIFFKSDELKNFFSNQDKLNGDLLQISQLYAKDNTVLQTLNGKMFRKQYKDIPIYKMQLMAKNPQFQSQILELNDYEYKLYSKMTQLVSQKTDRWNRFEKNIVENLLDGYYGELINDLYQQAEQGNKITTKDIETLTLLFSKQLTMEKSYLYGEHLSYLKSSGCDETEIRKNEAIFCNNIFNIKNKKELEHFEEIKELVCDTVLINSSLDDEHLTIPLNKYLKNFKSISELDRIKLALLEKYYNIDLAEAKIIVQTFSADIDNIPVTDEYQTSIIEQVKAIKNIFECNDINTLNQVGELNLLLQTDLSLSPYLIEQSKEIFEQLYKENLYMPKEEDKIGITTFNEKNIEVFDANTNFSMIVKRINHNENNSQEIWNSMTKKVDGKDILRYYTSCSYMTDENILKQETIKNGIILGFAHGAKKYSFDAIYTKDAHSPYEQDDLIYNDLTRPSMFYLQPSTLETYTDNKYNEIVINTLGIDDNGQMIKMQPDYVIYIKEQNSIKNLDDDLNWINSKKVASEFGIPIVIVDEEKIRESEKNKIASMSEKINENMNSNEILKFVKKVEHYTCRYDIEDVLEYASKDRIEILKKYLEQKQVEEKGKVSISKISTTSHFNEVYNDNRQNIIKRQKKLKEDNIITGEER